MPLVSIGRDALACVLAFLQESEEIASAARVSHAWHAASHSLIAWSHAAVRVASSASLGAMPSTVRRVITSLHVDEFTEDSTISAVVRFSEFPRVQHLRLDLWKAGLEWDSPFLTENHSQSQLQSPSESRLEPVVGASELPVRSLHIGGGGFVIHHRLHSLLCDRLRFRFVETIHLEAVHANDLSSLALAHNLRRLTLCRLIMPTHGLSREEGIWTALRGLSQLHAIEAPQLHSSRFGTPLPSSLTHLVIRPHENLAALLAPLRAQLRHLDLIFPLGVESTFVPADQVWVDHRIYKAIFDLFVHAPQFEFLALRQLDTFNLILFDGVSSLLAGSHFRVTHFNVNAAQDVAHEIVLERHKISQSALSTNEEPTESTSEILASSSSFSSSAGVVVDPPQLQSSRLPDLDWSHSMDYLTSLEIQVSPNTPLVFHFPHLIRLAVRGPHDDPTCTTALWGMIARHPRLESLQLELRGDHSGLAETLTSPPRFDLRVLRLSDGGHVSWTKILDRANVEAIAKLPSLATLHLDEVTKCVPDTTLRNVCGACTSNANSWLREIAIIGRHSDKTSGRIGSVAHDHPTIRFTLNGGRVRPRPDSSRCLVM